MSSMRGVVMGVLGLSALDAVLAGAQAGNNAVGTTFTLASGIFRRLVDPTVPLIPDLRTASSSAGSSSSSSTPPLTPAQAGNAYKQGPSNSPQRPNTPSAAANAGNAYMHGPS